MEIAKHWRLRRRYYRPSVETCGNCGENEMAIGRPVCRNCGVIFKREEEKAIKVEGTIFEIKVRASGVK